MARKTIDERIAELQARKDREVAVMKVRELHREVGKALTAKDYVTASNTADVLRDELRGVAAQ